MGIDKKNTPIEIDSHKRTKGFEPDKRVIGLDPDDIVFDPNSAENRAKNRMHNFIRNGWDATAWETAVSPEGLGPNYYALEKQRARFLKLIDFFRNVLRMPITEIEGDMSRGYDVVRVFETAQRQLENDRMDANKATETLNRIEKQIVRLYSDEFAWSELSRLVSKLKNKSAEIDTFFEFMPQRDASSLQLKQYVETALGMMHELENEKDKTKPQEEFIVKPVALKLDMTKILFLTANPTDAAELQLEEEQKRVEEVLFQSSYNLKSKKALKVDDLMKTIVGIKPSILHFSGHGYGRMVDGKRGIGLDSDLLEDAMGLILENDKKQKVLVRTQALADMFDLLQEDGVHINLILLNACYSAAQADALLPYCNYLIGMTDAIGDEDACAFAKNFYQWLVNREGDVEKAFKRAKMELNLSGYADKDLPKLYKKQV